jgi:uncharacterized protein YecE (DUF72 family)
LFAVGCTATVPGMSPVARVGISGWRYPSWRGSFYPKGLVQREELAFAAERFGSVEINGSFYSLQRPTSYERWRDETPEGFVFAVKGGRFITHMLALRNTRTALANFLASGVLALGPKLGPVLWQLPERQHFDAEQLDVFLGSLPTSTGEAAALAAEHDEKVEGRAWLEIDADRPLRHALEVRHPSFATAQAYDLLERHNVALVVADTAGRWPLLRELTSDFVYLRLHGSTELYASGYTDLELDDWAGEVSGWLGSGRDVYAYFDNDANGHAPFDALGLIRRLPADARP